MTGRQHAWLRQAHCDLAGDGVLALAAKEDVTRDTSWRSGINQICQSLSNL